MPRRLRGGNADVTLLEVVTSYSDVSATSFLAVAACVVAVADVGCAIALYGVVHAWAPGAWWPLAILKNTWDKQVNMNLQSVFLFQPWSALPRLRLCSVASAVVRGGHAHSSSNCEFHRRRSPASS